ncbi:MAG TPA: extracellular solute-binding protein [Acidimicrobiales bacterium]|nr:extracellular solute-binding protein [Acidimicrobiales bacterium]
MTTLRVALIGGPQYDQVERCLGDFAQQTGVVVEVAFRADHPGLNRHLAGLLPSDHGYDLVSTHSKYAPSQARWLTDLDGLVDTTAMAPAALALCRPEGALLCVPRNIDVRLLWGHRRMLGTADLPGTWTELAEAAAKASGGAGVAFPGQESGLFGTFFELVVAEGGELFDEEARPRLTCDEAHFALSYLVGLHRQGLTPPDLPEWGYDDVASGLRDARVALAGDWPGYYALMRASAAAGDIEVGRYPAGSARRAVYSGCHGWAIPSRAPHRDEAVRLLAHLSAAASATTDAAQGMVPARTDVALPATDELDQRRNRLLSATVAEDMITFPPLARYPEIEEAAWQALNQALRGLCDVPEALNRAQAVAEEALRPH